MDENGIIITRGGDEFTFENIGIVEGFEFPSTRPVIEDISGPQSSIWITSKFGRRPLSFQFTFLDDFLANRRAAGLVLRQGELVLMKFGTCDDLLLQAYIQINKLLMPYRKGRTIGMIDAVAPDWRFYSQTQVVSNSAASPQVITNNGNEDTDPVFRINGAGTVFVVTNTTTGKTFTITTTLTGSEWVEIDMTARTIVDDTGTSLFSSFAGDFFTLIPGINSITFAVTGSDGSTSLRTTFRHAYIGI